MTVQPHDIGTFMVSSESRPDMCHLVDLEYQESYEKPHPACSCEAYLANETTKGKVCKHIKTVQAYTQSQ